MNIAQKIKEQYEETRPNIKRIAATSAMIGLAYCGFTKDNYDIYKFATEVEIVPTEGMRLWDCARNEGLFSPREKRNYVDSVMAIPYNQTKLWTGTDSVSRIGEKGELRKGVEIHIFDLTGDGIDCSKEEFPIIINKQT